MDKMAAPLHYSCIHHPTTSTGAKITKKIPIKSEQRNGP
jgi:hypothetical protein